VAVFFSHGYDTQMTDPVVQNLYLE
jgi:hypothetical protein